MKRFDKSVEDMLIGKYGIKWKNESYYQVYDTYVSVQDGIKHIHLTDCNKYIRLLEILGILEYELDRVTCASPCCISIFNCATCAINIGELEDAKKIVRAEIQQIQGGKG
jgi:hypothetical protein